MLTPAHHGHPSPPPAPVLQHSFPAIVWIGFGSESLSMLWLCCWFMLVWFQIMRQEGSCLKLLPIWSAQPTSFHTPGQHILRERNKGYFKLLSLGEVLCSNIYQDNKLLKDLRFWKVIHKTEVTSPLTGSMWEINSTWDGTWKVLQCVRTSLALNNHSFPLPSFQ